MITQKREREKPERMHFRIYVIYVHFIIESSVFWGGIFEIEI